MEVSWIISVLKWGHPFRNPCSCSQGGVEPNRTKGACLGQSQGDPLGLRVDDPVPGWADWKTTVHGRHQGQPFTWGKSEPGASPGSHPCFLRESFYLAMHSPAHSLKEVISDHDLARRPLLLCWKGHGPSGLSGNGMLAQGFEPKTYKIQSKVFLIPFN